VGARAGLDDMEKILAPPPGLELQPVASRYPGMTSKARILTNAVMTYGQVNNDAWMGLGEKTKTFNEDRRPLGRDLNLGLSEY
jgi:hypothetical protein